MDRLSRLLATATAAQAPADLPLHAPRSLRGATAVVTGASRGIGKAIALALAAQGCNVALLAKTDAPNPKLPGTVHSARDEVQAAADAAGLGARAIAVKCDIRMEQEVVEAIRKTVEAFGGIDILVNNASAISITNTEMISMKTYDLMQSVNARGTFLCSKACLPYLKESKKSPTILNLSPPLTLNPKWYKSNVGYAIAKMGMSLCTLGMASEFRQFGITVNSLWPRTFVATAAVDKHLGGDSSIRRSRRPEVMSDAALIIFQRGTSLTGRFFLDEQILRAAGITDLSPYRISPDINDDDLILDGFVDE